MLLSTNKLLNGFENSNPYSWMAKLITALIVVSTRMIEDGARRLAIRSSRTAAESLREIACKGLLPITLVT